jgi:hypothetical protein
MVVTDNWPHHKREKQIGSFEVSGCVRHPWWSWRLATHNDARVDSSVVPHGRYLTTCIPHGDVCLDCLQEFWPRWGSVYMRMWPYSSWPVFIPPPIDSIKRWTDTTQYAQKASTLFIPKGIPNVRWPIGVCAPTTWSILKQKEEVRVQINCCRSPAGTSD